MSGSSTPTHSISQSSPRSGTPDLDPSEQPGFARQDQIARLGQSLIGGDQETRAGGKSLTSLLRDSVVTDSSDEEDNEERIDTPVPDLKTQKLALRRTLSAATKSFRVRGRPSVLDAPEQSPLKLRSTAGDYLGVGARRRLDLKPQDEGQDPSAAAVEETSPNPYDDLRWPVDGQQTEAQRSSGDEQRLKASELDQPNTPPVYLGDSISRRQQRKTRYGNMPQRANFMRETPAKPLSMPQRTVGSRDELRQEAPQSPALPPQPQEWYVAAWDGFCGLLNGAWNSVCGWWDALVECFTGPKQS